MWLSAAGEHFACFCTIYSWWGNTGGQQANVYQGGGLIKTQCAPWPWQTLSGCNHILALSCIPVTNAKCFFSQVGYRANLDPVNEMKKEAGIASAHKLSTKTVAGIICVRTTKTFSWRPSTSNIKMSKWMIGFININISRASQCVCINGAGALQTPPNVSWFMAEAITSCQCTDAWWANRCR